MFILENAFENVVCEMAAILPQLQYVGSLRYLMLHAVTI